MPQEVGGSMEVLPEELNAMLYKPKASEWPSTGLEEECDRILRGLEQIMELSIAEPFIAPVDLNSYPMYAYVVEYPVDLTIIKARLQNRFYRYMKMFCCRGGIFLKCNIKCCYSLGE